MTRRCSALFALTAILALASPALAQEHEPPPAHDVWKTPTPSGRPVHGEAADPHGAAQGPAGHDVGAAAPSEHGSGAHAEGHHEAPGEINWFHGFLGTKPHVEPSLLWRPVGMPPPFGALLLNTALLFFLLGYFGRRPVGEALKRRKADILRGIDEAAGMKADARAQLEGYEAKLARIQDEIERVRREMRETGEAERDRLLREAQDKRERLEREARTVVALELKAAREELKAEAIRSALVGARELLERQIGQADQERLIDEYLVSLDKAQLGGAAGPAGAAAPGQSGGPR